MILVYVYMHVCLCVCVMFMCACASCLCVRVQYEDVNAAIQRILKDMHRDMGAPEQNEQTMLDLRMSLADVEKRLMAFSDHRSAFQPVTSPPNSQVCITYIRTYIPSQVCIIL